MEQQLDFLKRHGFVIAGVGLPILVVLAFVLARLAPRYLVEDPRFDLVYVCSEGYSATTGNRVRDIAVVDGRLRVRWSLAEETVYAVTEHVYRLDGANTELRELQVPEADDLPRELLLGEPQELFFEGLEDVRLETALISPDGYAFESSYAGGRGLFGEIFSHGSRRARSVIHRNGRRIGVPQPSAEAYGYGNVRFLGWAIPNEDGR